MKTFHHILVPTDFEEASVDAIEIAVSLAQTCEAKITLLHVREIPNYPYMDFMLNSEAIRRVEEAAVERLSAALEGIKKRLPTAVARLKAGLPRQGIMEELNLLKPDLVVMGTHGRRGLGRAILGSVVEELVRTSPVPVLTVHAKLHP